MKFQSPKSLLIGLKPQPVCLIHTRVQVHKSLILFLIFCLFFRGWWRLWTIHMREKQIQCNQSPLIWKVSAWHQVCLSANIKFQQTASFNKCEKGNRSFQGRFNLKLRPVKTYSIFNPPLFPDSLVYIRYTKIRADTPFNERDYFPHRLW